MPNLSDATEIRLGGSPVREVYLGDKLVWPAKLLHWVFDFEAPGNYTVNIPRGAKYVYYWVTSGGAAGQDGDGGLNRDGLGGAAGGLLAGKLAVSVTTGKVTIGEGGQPNNQQGGISFFTLGTKADSGYSSIIPPTQEKTTNTDRSGVCIGYSSSSAITAMLNKVPGMIGDGKIQVINGGIYNGPPGTNGGAGVRGGGGSGGKGGIFGNYKRGGVGGNGFCRLVFTNKQVE